MTATVTLDLVPFEVPTTVTIVADVSEGNDGYNTPVPSMAVADLDLETRQTLIDDFAIAVLAL